MRNIVVPNALAVLIALTLAGCVGGATSPPATDPGGDGGTDQLPAASTECPADLAERYSAAGFESTMVDVGAFVLPAGATISATPTCVVETPLEQSVLYAAYYLGASASLLGELDAALTAVGYTPNEINDEILALWGSETDVSVTASAFTDAASQGEVSGISGPLVVITLGG